MSRFILVLSFSLFCLSVSAQGNCVRGNCLDGKGKIVFPDGASYDGDFRKGKFQGTGIMKYPGGAMYVGGWHKSVQEGRGRMTEADGTSYIGGFHNGKRHGDGVITFPNRNRMEATFVYDQVEGEVTFKFANGDFYVGEMTGTTIEGQESPARRPRDYVLRRRRNARRHLAQRSAVP